MWAEYSGHLIEPEASKVRTWKDRTGQFKVEAEFLGLKDNKIRLHKLNGVIVEVPLEKMSPEDTAYLKKRMARDNEDDEGGSSSRDRRQQSSRSSTPSLPSQQQQQRQQQQASGNQSVGATLIGSTFSSMLGVIWIIAQDTLAMPTMKASMPI